MREGQASLETIIIFSVSVFIILILLNAGINTQSSATDTLRLSQARTTVETLATSAEEVWSEGPGASTKVVITVPSEVNESESGILGGKTIRYRVLTKRGFSDISEVSNVNITGTIPVAGGEYEVLLTARENDVLLSVINLLSVTTDEDSFCEGDTLHYYISAIDEDGNVMNTNVTVQLIDAGGVVRDEENKTTSGGLTNGTFTVPSVGSYGWWKVYAFTNETSDYKSIYVANCHGGANLSITSCHTNSTNLTTGESANLACWVTGTYPIDSVIFTISGNNYSAFPDSQNWWNYTLHCTSPQNLTWTSAWANDTSGNSAATTDNLPITISCSAPQCVPGYYSWVTNNESSFNEGSYFHTKWDSYVKLNYSHYGIYTSRIFDSNSNSTWENMSWSGFVPDYDSNPVLLLHLEEHSSPFYDSSGNENHAYCSGSSCPQSTATPFGNGLYFDGINDYITVYHGNSLNVKNMTISLWVNRTADASWDTLLEKRNEYRIRIDGNNKPIFYVGGFGEVYSNTSLPLNQWALVTATFLDIGNGNNIARIYINGQLTGQRGPAWGSPSPTTNDFVIGGRNHHYFRGVIDEVSILNTSLNAITLLNASYRVCNNNLCTGAAWSNDYSVSPVTINKAGRYFQYRFKFFSTDNTTSPGLYNVTVNYYNPCYSGIIYGRCTDNSDCSSGYCRQDFVDDNNWYCVADSDDCTEAGISRDNGYVSCVDSSTQITCDSGVWVNETTCNSYQGCNPNSTKATYCGWQEVSGTCTKGSGCSAGTPGACNDCGGFYEDAPFSSCSYTSGLPYCDKGCGAECDNSSDYYFNDAGDLCSYGCNDTCSFANVEVCGDPGDLYGNTCFYGTNGCNLSGCTTSSEECPFYCINDYDGGTCALYSRTNPSNQDICYYNRSCSTAGCNLSGSSVLRENYCDYCTSSGAAAGDYSPPLNSTCTSNCPNSGTRYWDDTVDRNDDCDGNGNTRINTEYFQKGFIYPSKTSAGHCDNTECANDCGGAGICLFRRCICAFIVNITVFDEDFSPTPYYYYNWTRKGTDWDSKNNAACHSSGGCAHADGWCDETHDWIVTRNNLIDLSGANNAYLDFWVRSDTSFDHGDYLRVWCYDGSNWVKIYEEDCGDWTTTGTYYHRNADISPACFISNARFKVTIISNSNAEDVFIDDFRIKKEVRRSIRPVEVFK